MDFFYCDVENYEQQQFPLRVLPLQNVKSFTTDRLNFFQNPRGRSIEEREQISGKKVMKTLWMWSTLGNWDGLRKYQICWIIAKS